MPAGCLLVDGLESVGIDTYVQPDITINSLHSQLGTHVQVSVIVDGRY